MVKKEAPTKDISEAWIKSATYTSVWDDCIRITTNCKVNTHTRKVFDIERAHDSITSIIQVLNTEYVTVDGIDYPVGSDLSAGAVFIRC